ncbi:hypothetical protein ACWEPL_46820 [Nonomuraea sp. NPDC004186]
MRKAWTALAAALALAGGLTAAPAQAAAASVKVGRVTASPARYAGSCPATTAFAAKVAVRGANRVTYRWLRGDGTKGPIRTAQVKGGAVVVRDRQMFAASASGWQALQVLSPRKATSAKARFTVSCDPLRLEDVSEDRTRIGVTLATPAPYRGACRAPGRTVTFDGRITVSRTPAAVAYRWVDGDGGAEPVERLWLTARSTAVSSRRTFLTGHSGHRRLEILDVKGRVTDSAQVPYRVTCTDPPEPGPVAAAANPRVTPARYEGPCGRPVEFVFRVDLAVTKPAKVTYQWVRGDGTTIPGEVMLGGDLTTVLETTWKVTDPSKVSGGSAYLRVLTPNATTTQPAAFTITCRDGDAVTITGTQVIESRNPQPCPGTSKQFTILSQVTPTPSASLPLTISYRWRWADGSYTAPFTHTFTQAAALRPQRVWDEWISKTGKIWLEVTANGRVTRGEAIGYAVDCGGKPPADSYPHVVSVTEASITPATYRGECPVTLKARAKVTVSAPMEQMVYAQWYFDETLAAWLDGAAFPPGDPLTKVIEREFMVDESTGRTVTGYMETRLPNVVASGPMTYSVTCT